MAQLPINLGISDFKKLRTESLCYVDKTAILEDLLTPCPNEVTLLTRPRKFGKSLTLSMLKAFFEIQKDPNKAQAHKDLFTGLYIAQNAKLCAAWQQQYPVLALSLKDVEGSSFAEALCMLQYTLVRLCQDNPLLLTDNSVKPNDQKLLTELAGPPLSQTQLKTALASLVSALSKLYAKPVIILLDDYDMPLERAVHAGYYQDMLAFMRGFLGLALKDNPNLCFAVITGCVQIASASIIADCNNFTCYSIAHHKYATHLGFTLPEVQQLLREADLIAKQAEVISYFASYNFGQTTQMFCPWTVLKYIQTMQEDPIETPSSYWLSTTDDAAILQLLKNNTQHFAGQETAWARLLQGEPLPVKINPTINLDTAYSTPETFLSLLYYAGYLTLAPQSDTKHQGQPDRQHNLPLILPHGEMTNFFKQAANAAFTAQLKTKQLTDFFNAFWQGDMPKVEEHINTLLLQHICYYQSPAEYCTGFIIPLFTKGYKISQQEDAQHNILLVIADPHKQRIAELTINMCNDVTQFTNFQVQHTEPNATLLVNAPYRAQGYTNILHWILVFYQNRCRVFYKEGIVEMLLNTAHNSFKQKKLDV